MAKLALRFISGKYKGGEFVLPEGKEVFVGRSSGVELVLMEDMVSRKHARLVLDGEQIAIEDLGSTNGTFVNGEKISSSEVGKGDRILIGTSIMKVVEESPDEEGRKTGASPALGDIEKKERVTTHGSRSMTGTIAEVPLPDLIQLFTTSKKTGTLIINHGGIMAKIHLENGSMIHASIDTVPGLAPLKAIYRILSWDDGTFELIGPEEHAFEDKIELPTEHILMEGLRQLDELQHIKDKLPPMEAELVVVTPLEARLADLDVGELDVFQLVYNHGKVQAVMDHAIDDDLDVANRIQTLIKKGYISEV